MDLLELMADLDRAPAVDVHALMPDMLTACRLCTIWDCKTCHHRIANTTDCGWTFYRKSTTCPDCLLTDIEYNSSRMQGRQARATS